MCALEPGCWCRRQIPCAHVVRCVWPCALWNLHAGAAAKSRCQMRNYDAWTMDASAAAGCRCQTWARCAAALALPAQYLLLFGVYAGVIFIGFLSGLKHSYLGALPFCRVCCLVNFVGSHITPGKKPARRPMFHRQLGLVFVVRRLSRTVVGLLPKSSRGHGGAPRERLHHGANAVAGASGPAGRARELGFWTGVGDRSMAGLPVYSCCPGFRFFEQIYRCYFVIWKHQLHDVIF